MADSHRVNVNISDATYNALVDEIARPKGKTMSDVVREAIALKAWVERTQREGGRILVERDGEIREIVTP